MKALIILVFVLALVTLCYFLTAYARWLEHRHEIAVQNAPKRWMPTDRTEGEDTVVGIELRKFIDGEPVVLSYRKVGTVRNDDREYELKYLELTEMAYSRCMTLNINANN